MRIVLICFLCFTISGTSQTLEEQLYQVTENFIANSNEQTLSLLEKAEANLKPKITTKDEQLALIFLLCNKAYYLRSKAPNKAINSYEEAWNVYTSHSISSISDYNIIEYCLKPLGNLYTKTGNFTNAEITINNYINLAKKRKDQFQQISGIINLSMLYQTLNKHQSVITLIDNTLNLVAVPSNDQKKKLLAIKQESLIKLGKTDSINLSDENSLYKKYELMYKVQLQKGNYKDALTYFDLKKTYTSPKTSRRDLAKLYLEEAQLYFLLSDATHSKTLLFKALETLLPHVNPADISSEDLYAENTFIDIFDQLALLETSPAKALQYYDHSFKVSQLLESTASSQETKLLNLSNNRIRSEQCISVCYDVFSQTKDSSYIIKALTYAEQYKAVLLKERQHQLSLLDRFPKDSLLIKEKHLMQSQEQLISSFVSGASDSVENSSKIQAIHFELKNLQKTLSEKYPDRQRISFSIDSLQHKLSSQKASLIEYFYGNNALYKFTISGEALAFKKTVLTDSIEKTILDFIYLFDNSSHINNNVSAFTAKAHEVYQLLDPVSETERLIIIPDGILNNLPFEALLYDTTSSLNFSDMPFMITEHILAYNSSISNFTQAKLLNQSAEVLGFFPVFSGTPQALSYSVNEANFLADEVPSTLFLNADASKDHFINNASKYPIIHLSTHASAGSYTLPASISFYDQPMNFNEFYNLNLKTNLVVLSACETGVGVLRKGEGAMSIARGFQYAGCPNILFSIWKINDQSTATIMKSFYGNYNDTYSGAVANQQSKLTYLQNSSISNIKKSPYYWSAFVFYGDFSEQQNESFSIINPYILALLVIIVLFLLFKIINSNAQRLKGTS